MNIEDGDSLPIHVTFEEEDSESYWHCQLAVLPHIGDTIVIGAAPKGVRHIVKRVDHHVGGASHRIVILIARTPCPPRDRTEGTGVDNALHAFVIYSPNESASNDDAGFWSSTSGWTVLKHATQFSAAERVSLRMPLSTGNDARFVPLAGRRCPLWLTAIPSV